MSTKAKSPRKPLTPAQKAAKAAKAKATREKKAAEEKLAFEKTDLNAGMGVDLSQILQAVKDGEFDKAVELANAIPDEGMHPKKRDDLIKEIEGLKVNAEKLAEVKSDVELAFNNGHFAKAVDLVKDLADDNPYKIEVLTKSAKMEKEAGKSIRPTKKPKVIEFDDVLKKWQDSVDILKAYRDQQQKAGKAFIHIHVGYHRSNQFMLRFKRNQPK